MPIGPESSHPWEDILLSTSRPQQYTGGEWNLDPSEASHGPRVTLVYPDVYELGMSNCGLTILRHVLLSTGGLDVRRAFAPAPDLHEILTREGLDWVDLENGDPVRESRVVGFGVPCESLYTNVLHLVGLMGLRYRSVSRAEDDPIVLLGGGGLSNPLPLAPFADAVFLGEAEEVAPDLFRILAGPGGKAERLAAAADLPGVFIPFLGRRPVSIQRVGSLKEEWAPVRQLVPLARISQDRAVVEVARGCTRGCRFCQASFISRPVRERPPEEVAGLLDRALECTGWEKGGLLTLSYSDYSRLDDLMALSRRIGIRRHADIGKPSLRPDTLLRMRSDGPMTGRMTIAPEAGTERLRYRLNKDISDSAVLDAADAAFRMGAKGLKLYFMLGLPGETEEDVRGLSELVLQLAGVARRNRKKPLKSITVALSPFVPKAHTPLQWAAMLPEEELWRRIGIVRELCGRNVSVTWNSPRVALIEAVLGLGDDGLTSDILECAVKQGASFDAWADRFRWDIWERVLLDHEGPLDGVLSGRVPGAPLPWDFVSPGPSRDYLEAEWLRYSRGEFTSDCRESGCSGCGACTGDTHPDGLPAGKTVEDGAGTEPVVPAAVLRVRYSKTGLARFSSHLDCVRLWGRVVRRSGLPVVWSRGYVNRPKLQFGPPLPLGMESVAEYVDILLSDPAGEEPVSLLKGYMPKGFRIVGAWLLPVGCKPPSRGVSAAGYSAGPGTGTWASGSAADVAAELAGHGNVLQAEVLEDGSVSMIISGEGRENRPDVLLEGMVTGGPARVCRTELYRMSDRGLEPLGFPGP